MKHLLTAIACCLAVAGSAQFPYNPDSDGDNLIGMEDFLDFLPFFGGPFFPSANHVIDTLDWSGVEMDTLALPLDADIVVFLAGNCSENQIENEAIRLFTIPEIEGFKQWLVFVNPLMCDFTNTVEYYPALYEVADAEIAPYVCQGLRVGWHSCTNIQVANFYSLNGIVGVIK